MVWDERKDEEKGGNSGFMVPTHRAQLLRLPYRDILWGFAQLRMQTELHRHHIHLHLQLDSNTTKVLIDSTDFDYATITNYETSLNDSLDHLSHPHLTSSRLISTSGPSRQTRDTHS